MDICVFFDCPVSRGVYDLIRSSKVGNSMAALTAH